MQNKEHKLAAIIFTDIVGYTRQMEENEQRTMQLLQRQRELLFPLVKEYNGEVIKEIGDGLLMMFNSAIDAVQFAISAQQLLKDEDLTLRAGIHMGDVIFKDGDVFGSAVNTAARIEPLAEPNGICISESVKHQLGNKDIRMISCGKKELKGVNRPIEVFNVFIEGVTEEKKVTITSFLTEIWKLRVIQLTGLYILTAWVIKLAISSIVARNMLSPHLVDLIWIILISLIPIVAIIAFYHGKRESNKWHKVELIGLPANILFTIFLVIFMFRGKELGATTESVIIQNENGESVEHYIVKSEFRKKICLYNLKNIGNDTSIDYLQYMIPVMLEYDLTQDVFISPLSSIKFFQKLADAGYKDGLDIPIPIMKKYATYYHLQFFLTGSISYNENTYSISTRLYETKNGKLLKTRKYSGTNIFEVSDEIAVDLKVDMGIPQAQIDQTTDLPIADIFTHSTASLKYYSLANKELIYSRWNEAIKYFEKSLKEDPNNTIAHLSTALVFFNTNQMEKAKQELELTMAQIDKIPERMQFSIKSIYYLINQEPDKAISVLKMWSNLYPDDVGAHANLAMRYQMSNDIIGAINEYKTILLLDPEQYNYLPEIGKLYDKINEPDSAILYFLKYAEKFPKDYKSYVNIGDYYNKTANFHKAKEYYEKASLLEPSNISTSIKLAENMQYNGDFDLAYSAYLNSLKSSKNAADSSDSYHALSSYYHAIGKLNTSLDYLEKSLKLKEKYTAPLQITVQKCFSAQYYIQAGKSKEIFIFLDKVKKEFQAPLDKISAFGYMFAYIEENDAENAEKQIADAEELAKAYGEKVLLANIYYGWGKIHDIRGDYEKAIESYHQFILHQPSSYKVHRNISSMYRKLGQYDKAEEYILIALKHQPYSVKSNYEASLLYSDMGNDTKALEHIKKASKKL